MRAGGVVATTTDFGLQRNKPLSSNAKKGMKLSLPCKGSGRWPWPHLRAVNTSTGQGEAGLHAPSLTSHITTSSLSFLTCNTEITRLTTESYVKQDELWEHT